MMFYQKFDGIVKWDNAPDFDFATSAKGDLMENYIEAHKFSSNHMESLKKDSKCGCFYCLRIFSPSEIDTWLIGNNPSDKFGTALCPYCGIDSIIGESSGYLITKEFLQKMHDYWFQR